MRNQLVLPLTTVVVSLAVAPTALALATLETETGESPELESQPSGELIAQQSGSGGLAASPLIHGAGGGALAPPNAVVAKAAQAGAQPEPVLGQAPAASGPAGRQQGGGERPAEVEKTAAEGPAPDRAQPGVTALAAQANDPDQDDSLPMTGFGLAALAAVGLGLVIAGVALRPREGPKAPGG